LGDATKKFELPEAIVADSLVSFYCKADDCNVEQAIKDFLIVDGPKTLAASKISGHPAPQTEVINIECLPILHKAASDGNIQHVKSLIEHAEDINAMSGFRNSTKYTPLMLAAKNGHLEVVQYLHQHGANITIKDSQQFNALYYAAENGHLEVVKYLIENGAKSDINMRTGHEIGSSGTPLFIAARNGYFNIVTYLHQHGGNVNVEGGDILGTALFHAVRNGHIEIAQFLRSNVADDSGIKEDPLLMASAKGHLEVVKNLLHSGTDVNVKGYLGYTPLIWASRMGRLETVKYLLQSGANMDAKTKHDVRFYKVEDDLTSMLMASRYGHLQIVKYLHENGGDINFKNNKNESALFLASFNGHVQVVEYLDENGSDVNDRSYADFYMPRIYNIYNTTPLAISARHGHLEG
jgi:ankyrin repeat protein